MPTNSTVSSPLDSYIERSALARALKKSVRTLDRWHTERRGPRRTKIGRSIYYSRKSVAAWLRSLEAPDE